MDESKETDDKADCNRKPLSLKRTVDTGHVQQKFSHGRSKSVVVEKKRKRADTTPRAESVRAAAGRSENNRGNSRRSSSKGTKGALSQEEVAKRAAALAAAQRATAEAVVRKAKQEAAEQEVRRKAPAEAAEREKALEAAAKAAELANKKNKQQAERKLRDVDKARNLHDAISQKKHQDETVQPSARSTHNRISNTQSLGKVKSKLSRTSSVRSRADEPLLKSMGMVRPMIVTRTDRPDPKKPEVPKKSSEQQLRRSIKPMSPPLQMREEDDDRRKRGNKRSASRADEGRVRGKLTITNAFDERQRERSLASLKRKREREKQKAMGISQLREKISREVVIPEVVTIQELANRMTERAVDLIKYLMKQGAMNKINDVIDTETAQLIVEEFGHRSKLVSEADVE